MTTNHVTFCRICEPYCGLIATVDDGVITKLAPDPDHVLSRGFACKKGLNAHHLTHDAKRITRPMRRRTDGTFEAISWQAAIDAIGAKLNATRRAHGPHAIGLYVGNPAAFAYPHRLYATGFADAIGTRNVYGPGSTDNLSVFLAAHFLFGSPVMIPIPDVDRTDMMLCVGVNPAVSHGTILNLHRPLSRLKAITKRGGRLVVIDPRRSETAALASTHHFIRPDTDAWLLLAMIKLLFDERLVDTTFLARHGSGVDALRSALEPFTVAEAARRTQIDADTISALARDFAAADSAVCYSRVAVGRFGTVACWAAQLLNVVTGNLDRAGGAIFGDSYTDVGRLAKWGGLASYDRHRSRIGSYPDVMGELPSGILADEITTPGRDQIRALIVDAGNPVVSTAGGEALADALPKLELLVSIDLQLNATNRHADFILPATSMFERADFPLVHASLLSEPYVQWTEPVIAPVGEALEEWEIYQRLSDAMGLDVLAKRVITWARRGLKRLGKNVTPEPLLDLLLRAGPLGDRYGLKPGGLSLAKLKRHPHGIRLSAKRTGVLRKRLRTRDKRVRLFDPRLAPELARLQRVDEPDELPLRLIGRRDVRSHNSWMHHVAPLMSKRCTRLRVHPDDAATRGLVEDASARLSSANGSLDVVVAITDEVMPGVVSLPHGWSRRSTSHPTHDANPAPNANDLMDRHAIEPLAGMAFLNGVPVELQALPTT